MPVSQAQATPSPAAPSESVKLPALVLNARFGLSIIDAKLTYVDQKTSLSNTVEHLNVRVRDLSLSRKTEIELWADLKTKMQDLVVDGPLKLTAELTPDARGGGIQGGAFKFAFSADDLVVEKGTLFKKAKGVPARFAASLSMDATQFKIQESSLRFHNAEVSLSGKFEKLGAFDLKFDAKPVQIFNKRIFKRFTAAFDINVFDPQQKLSAQLARHALVLQGRVSVAQMQIAIGRGREAQAGFGWV